MNHTPEVVESWTAQMVIDAEFHHKSPEQIAEYLNSVASSQKQKQIEEIVGIAEKLKLGEFAHYSCGDGEGSCECTEPDYDRALDDLITKTQAKQ